VMAVHDLKRISAVLVHGDAEDKARFARALAVGAAPSDSLAPEGATSAWTSAPASLRAAAEDAPEAQDAARTLHAYLSQYLQPASAPAAP